MGELVRLVLEDCVEEGLLFSGLNSAQLHIPGAFPTKDLSQNISRLKHLVNNDCINPLSSLIFWCTFIA